MYNYAEKSCISPEKWQMMITIIDDYGKEGNDPNLLQPSDTWNNIPIGQFIEDLRQLRAEGKMTRDEVKIFDSYKIKSQYRERHWLYMYNRAKAYFLLHGHIQVKDSEDKELCQWLGDQRKKYREAPRSRNGKGKETYTKHSEEQKRLLEEIDIVWDVSSFTKYYPLLVEYHSKRGDCDVPYPCWIKGRELFHWVRGVQVGKIKVSEEQKKLLRNLNFEFKKKKERYNNGTSFPEQAVFYYFRKIFEDAENRIRINGFELDMYSQKANVAIEYDGLEWHRSKQDCRKDNAKDLMCKENNIKLIRIREKGLVTTDSAITYFVDSTDLMDEPLRTLFNEQFGVSDIHIDIKSDCMEIMEYYLNLESIAINRHIKELVDYVKKHNSFPPSNKDHSGLYGVVLLLREMKKGRGNGKGLTERQINILDEIGMIWNPQEYDWEVGYNHAKEYYKTVGDLDVRLKYTSPDGYHLGQWIYNQRHKGSSEKRYRGKLLTQEKKDKLNEIKMIW